jgi:hypothetical protein
MSADPGRAAVSWQKAEAHLCEASAQDADVSPMAVIHSSYYAMFHAARVLAVQGSNDVLFHGIVQCDTNTPAQGGAHARPRGQA